MTPKAIKANGIVSLRTGNGFQFMAITINAELPETTSISAINTKTINNGVIYNLSGQRVDENYHGIVIQNGKKVVR